MKKKKREGEKKEVSEIFEVEKGGEKKIVEAHGTEEEKAPTEKQVKKENKILKNIIIIMAGFVLMFLVIYLIINSMNTFEVNGVKFQIVKEGKLIFYKTSLPVVYQGKDATYNFYLREDPRQLAKKVPLTGNVTFRENLVLDLTTKDLFCNGDWNIGFNNMVNLYKLLDVNLLVKNDSVEYEPSDKYMFVTIQLGNSTNIEKVGMNEYDININNCEVIPAFERLMLETFIRYKEVNK